MGDFNKILSIKDRRGHVRITEAMRQFKGFVEKNDLMDVQLGNLKYT